VIPEKLVNWMTFPEWPVMISFLERADGWIYRGQPVPEKDAFLTSLDRAASFLKEDPLALERRAFREFKRRAGLSGAQSLPHDADTVQWLALLQHHGGPTRLLDFTHSLYVALFFAVEKAIGTAEIWCIRRSALEPKLEEPWNGDKNYALELILDPNKALSRKQMAAPIGQPPCAVFCDEPFYGNKRLSLQQGCFLIPFDVSKPFRDNLLTGTYLRGAEAIEMTDFNESLEKRDIFKFIIPIEQHAKIRRQLRRMNMTREHLFPGLDGLARSFRQEA